MLKLKLTMLITIAVISTFSVKTMAQTNASTTVSEQAAKKWINSREWSNGIELNVDNSVNATEFYRQYHANTQVWKKAFAFIREHNLDTLAPGKYPIDGDQVYASITENPSKELDQTKWESHRNYIDLQYVIRGKEKIGIIPIANTTVAVPYDSSKDNANYTSDTGTYYTAAPGTFFLFFPQDAHRPNIKVEGYPTVKKLVIKIHVTQ